MSEAFVDIRDLRVSFTGGRKVVQAVNGVDLQVQRGEVVALIGESGSGKSVTLRSMLRLHPPKQTRIEGSIRVGAHDVLKLAPAALADFRGKVASMIFQEPLLAMDPVYTVGAQIVEAIRRHEPVSEAQAWQRALQLFERVRIPSPERRLHAYPHELSGGMRQRAMIALALACGPQLLLADEPTTALDATVQIQILLLLRELQRDMGMAVIFVTHDIGVAVEISDRIAVMYGGRIVELGPREQIFSASRHPYTRRLLRAVPDIAGKRTVVGIPGHAALPGSRPDGCYFHPRCELATDECRATFPAVAEVGPGHSVRCHHSAVAARASAHAGAGQPAERSTGEEVVLAVRDLDAHHGQRHTLFDVGLEVHRQECLALVGESGSGKTTLARCVSGLHKDYTGEVRLGDAVLPPAARRRSDEARQRIQYVFQNPYASLNPRRSVGQTIARQLQRFGGAGRADISRRVAECLERVALSSAAGDRFPDQLSGGERQRVAIARALAAEPALLVCDEITSALDVSVQAAILELLGTLRTEMGLSLLFITHDLALIRTIADRVAVMNEGRIVEEGGVVDTLTSPRADYTRKLLANTPSIEVALGHAAAPVG